MTETARRLRRLGAPHARARAFAVLLGGVGAALAAAALGLALSPAVSGVTLAWALIVASAAAATWAVLRTRHEAAAPALGRLIESAAGGRAGSIVGVVSPTAGKGTGSSTALLLAADTRAAAVVSLAAPGVSSAMRRTTLRRVSYGACAALTGGLLFLAGSPASGRAAAFWHPVRTWREARAPVRLVVDQRTVRRGGSVTATVTVPGAVRATLWTRGPGEPWKPMLLALDQDGRVVQHVGPIESDLYLRASSGGRRSAEVKIDVALPAFLADLGLTARFPSYLSRADEPLLVGPDVIPLPAGTTVLTNGTASVPLGSAAWTLDSRVEQLRVVGTRIDGRFTPAASGTWRLRALSADGSALEGVAPELRLLIVPDSAPVVTLPVPSRDTTLPLSLHQPLVADVRDDHGISRLSVVSWRVSRTGRVFDAVRESLDVSGVGDRAIVQGRLDAEKRGLLPGDTLRLYVEAVDNAPTPHAGRSTEIALRLPSMEELRAQAREAARSVAQAADSVSAAQRELSDRTRDLASERNRDQDGLTAAVASRSRARCRSSPRSGLRKLRAIRRRCRSASRSWRRRSKRSPAPRRPRAWTTARSRIACARCRSCSASCRKRSRASIPKRPARPCNASPKRNRSCGVSWSGVRSCSNGPRSRASWRRLPRTPKTCSAARPSGPGKRRSVPIPRRLPPSAISPRPPIRWPKGWTVPARRCP